MTILSYLLVLLVGYLIGREHEWFKEEADNESKESK